MRTLDELDEAVLAGSWTARRSTRTTKRIVRLCIADWEDIKNGFEPRPVERQYRYVTAQDIRYQYRDTYGNPALIIGILLQILVPIIIELVKRWLDSREEDDAVIIGWLQQDIAVERREGWRP